MSLCRKFIEHHHLSGSRGQRPHRLPTPPRRPVLLLQHPVLKKLQGNTHHLASATQTVLLSVTVQKSHLRFRQAHAQLHASRVTRYLQSVPSPTLLVVSGLPASGKTQLGSRLARELGWPFVSKDEYKAILHDHLPELTRAQAGPLSFEIMYHVAGVVLAAGENVVLETHFYLGLSEPKITALEQAHRARTLQLFCEAPLAELRRRHADRVASGARPHIDLPFDHAELPPSACWTPLALAAPLRRVDTTAPHDLTDLARWVREQR